MAMISMAEALRRMRRAGLMDEAGLIGNVRSGIEANEQPIIEAIQDQQMQGKRSDGTKINPYKSNVYAEMKHLMNPNPGKGTPDYRLTGETQRQAELLMDATGFDYISDTPHFKYIKRREGDDKAFVMNLDNRNNYIRTVLHPYVVYIAARILNMPVIK